MDDDDRISQLPEHILQNHILSLLPQKRAVRTSVLSKSWRRLGPTRPKFVFRRSCFKGNEKFLSAVDKSLQRYEDDQKLSIREFVLELTLPDCFSNDSISLLAKWIPKVILNMGVKTFKLTTHRFSLPSVVFQAEFLEELCLEGCRLEDRIDCVVNLRALKRLSLSQLVVGEKTFEKIMSSCPLLEHLVLSFCGGLSRALVHEARNLKHVRFTTSFPGASFEIKDAPNLETMRISSLQKYHLHINYFYPRLKSLLLCGLHLPTDLSDRLSLNCPCLEVLRIHCCSGLTDLSSLSIKRRAISYSYS